MHLHYPAAAGPPIAIWQLNQAHGHSFCNANLPCFLVICPIAAANLSFVVSFAARDSAYGADLAYVHIDSMLSATRMSADMCCSAKRKCSQSGNLLQMYRANTEQALSVRTVAFAMTCTFPSWHEKWTQKQTSEELRNGWRVHATSKRHSLCVPIST